MTSSRDTTGDPKFSVFSVTEFRRWVEVFLRTYDAAGLRPSDRVANLFVSGSLYASFIFVNRLVEEMGWRSLGLIPSPIAGGDGNKEFLLAGRKP